MTIAQTSTIDGVGFDRFASEVVLLISDHMPWQDESGHIGALENKLGAYVNYISSRQYLEQLPGTRDCPIRIKLVHEHEPTASAERILNSVKDHLGTMNIRFSYESLSTRY